MEHRELVAFLHAGAVESASTYQGRAFNAAVRMRGGAYLPCVQFRDLDATVGRVSRIWSGARSARFLLPR